MNMTAEDIIDFYGPDAQLALMQEECAELITAISHMQRGREDADKEFLEELVDVHIMLEQMLTLVDDDDFAAVRKAKYDKVWKRLARDRYRKDCPGGKCKCTVNASESSVMVPDPELLFALVKFYGHVPTEEDLKALNAALQSVSCIIPGAGVSCTRS